MRKILTTLFLLPILGTFWVFSSVLPTDSRLLEFAYGRTKPLNHLSKSKQVSAGERLQLATLYGSMIAVGQSSIS